MTICSLNFNLCKTRTSFTQKNTCL